MRGTSKITNNNSLHYISGNLQNFMKATNKISAQQQVVNLEDNPLSANIGIRMNNAVAKVEQYNKSIATGIGLLNLTDGYLASCKTLMDKINVITTGAANDATTPLQRAANAIEMNEILRNLVMAGNGKDGERYIFGGQNTTSQPFTIVNGRYVNYTGNDKYINSLIDNQTTLAINATGTDAFGNMITALASKNMRADVTMSTDRATRLSDLNAGSGVPKGKILIKYSSYPDGLEVDLSGCDTLEDVKDVIEKATLEASRNLDSSQHRWLLESDPYSLDWHDLQDRYVKVTINPEHNGISLQEIDLGEPLPEPTAYERNRGMTYSGQPGYSGPGDFGVAIAAGGESTTVFDKNNTIYGGGRFYAPLQIGEVANNRVAEALGIKGKANEYDPSKPNFVADLVLDGFLHGRDLNPRLSERTLLADLEGYNDGVYTFTNGAKPQDFVVKETSQDANNVFNDWNLNGLTKGMNTGSNGDLYVRAYNRGTATDPEIHVEIYSRPLAGAKASDLVATGLYAGGGGGGTVVLNEANSSGLSGTVGVVLPFLSSEATVNLGVDFGESLQASVHVPAFIEETGPDGQPKDILNIASGWQIRGLDKPPAEGYDKNHPASTDLDGNLSVNYRYDETSQRFVVELCRPAFNDQPAKLVATANLYLGKDVIEDPPNSGIFNLANCVSGRVQFTGATGFEGVKGSVFLELPANCVFASASVVMGTDSTHPTTIAYQIQANAAVANAPAGTIVLGGAMELAEDQTVSASFVLKGDTLFKKGQTFATDLRLPNGYILPANTALTKDCTFPKGLTVEPAGALPIGSSPPGTLLKGTVLAAGQEIEFTGAGPAAGTVIPKGSYYSGGGGAGVGFPAANMSITHNGVNPFDGSLVPQTADPVGFNLQATFATIEDFNRAVEQSGIYVTSQISTDGKSLEFRSSLAGAWLTVSEDTDCYEQMGDKYEQLSNLDFNGLVRGVNTDASGNLYTEVIYYPPDPLYPGEKVKLISDNGDIIEIDPGYYVRVYKDKDELGKTYENRDNTLMVAEGFVPSGLWNPTWDPMSPPFTKPNVPFDPNRPSLETVGIMTNLVLEERNDSGVSGRTDLDYYGQREPVKQKTLPDGTPETLPNGDPVYDYNPYANANITVFPGGLRPEGTRHAVIQEWDMLNILPGVTCDYTGTYHGVMTGTQVGDIFPLTGLPVQADTTTNPPGLPVPDIRLYKDASHTALTARSDPSDLNSPDAHGRITLYEVDSQGRFALDSHGNRIPAGYMTVPQNSLAPGQSDNFSLTTGANRHYGQEREENVFSTINDIIDALDQNDVEKLHDLIGNIQKNIQHILSSAGDVGARGEMLLLLKERHADDILRFTTVWTERVGLDDKALTKAVLDYQASSNAYQAAMQVSSQIMQMGLLQYI